MPPKLTAKFHIPKAAAPSEETRGDPRVSCDQGGNLNAWAVSRRASDLLRLQTWLPWRGAKHRTCRNPLTPICLQVRITTGFTFSM